MDRGRVTVYVTGEMATKVLTVSLVQADGVVDLLTGRSEKGDFVARNVTGVSAPILSKAATALSQRVRVRNNRPSK